MGTGNGSPFFSMKWIFFAVYFFLLFSSYVTGIVLAQVADPPEPEHMDEKNLTKTVQVARGYVVVDGQERSLFIDYRNGLLFNLLKESNVCQQFDISNSTQGDNFVSGQIDLFGELKFIEEGNLQKEKDQRYSTAQVLYAPRAMMLRAVTAAIFEHFGITFTPGVTEYVVDQNHEDFDLLVEAAQYNASIGTVNPLILQLDITHLLSRFTGVPVRKKDKNEVTALSFVIGKEKELRELLPQQCSSL